MPADKPKRSFSPQGLPPRKALPPFEALRALDAVARLGGIRKAAQGLERDHAVISRHIRTIETWTGATLVERTPTGVVLTDTGRDYHARIAEAIDTIAQATLDMMKQSGSQPLQIWCMPGLAFHWLTGRLGAFEAAYPGVDIEVRPTDMSPDLMGNEADVDIRFVQQYGTPYHIDQGLRALELANLPIIGVASPGYLKARPVIERPEDLARHQLLHEEGYGPWLEWLAAHGVDGSDYCQGGTLLWQGHLTLDAARHGRGIALSNHLVAAADLAAGRLVEVGAGNPLFSGKTPAAYLFMARADRWEQPSVRRFRSWLHTAIAKEVPDA
ncbi:LysR substrate-binding domain-containing protein [Gimibacter soli]|uniref:LysR substrate-binding domain-containing protein n=1 Tax=Gimibacter soli TaxID=3024400 RepID=A0AAE9XNQ2_9PROT|nr:LysR substrate-binding domain-containing protein [Gimibacter soli]WCL53392.1 LysR substrate-binding domain-containing protein [Gimibacter soli]